MGKLKLTQRQIKVLGLAQFYHNADTQKRKNDNLPYWTHPLSVLKILHEHCKFYKTGMFEVALLHDILEDTSMSPNKLRNHLRSFTYTAKLGDIIVRSVIELTDVYTHENAPTLNRAGRKNLETARLARTRSPLTHTVKCADIAHNAQTIVRGEASFARVYLSEKVTLLGALKYADDSVRDVAAACIRQAFRDLNDPPGWR